jgi:hypothetical protein
MKWSVKASDVLTAVAVLLVGAAPARAKAHRWRPPPAACVAAHRTAEEQEQQDRLVEARAQLAACGHPSCGSISRQCRMERKRLEKLLPTMVPMATDEAGLPVPGAQLSIDGKPAPLGRPWPINPGPHELTFRSERGGPLAQKVVMVRGQRRRLISVIMGAEAPAKPSEPAASTADVFEAPRPGATVPAAPPTPAPEALVSEDPPPPRSPPRRRSIAPYLLGTVGLVGLGGYALLTTWGRADNDALSECKPLCPPETLDHIQRLYLAADISAAVGGAALVGSALWLLLRSGAPPAEERRPRTVLDVRPTRAGAIATVAGAF